MGHITIFLLLSGTALTAFALDQGGTREKRSAADGNTLSSLGDTASWQSHLNGFTSNFPVKGADQLGIGNFPGMSQASGSDASAKKRKRSAADKNPLSTLGEAGGWQSHLSGFTSNFPVKGADQLGIGNFPGMSQASGSDASAEKRKRSAADGNTLPSLGDTASWQSHLNGFTSNFPVKGGDQFGLGNFPGISQASGSGASAEKRKRSAADGNTLSSLGEAGGWQSHLSGFTSNFPVKGADQLGIGNFPGMSQASGSDASAGKRKRSAEDKNPLSSLGDTAGWQSHLNGFTSNFPVKGSDQFGLGNFPGISQASGSGASAKKRKRSAEDKNPLSSLGEAGGWQSHLSEFTSNFPVKGSDQFGLGNFPGISQASGSGASAEKRKRSAEDKNPLSSLGDTTGWQSHLNGFTSNFPVKGSDQFGLGNFPGISQASGSGASAKKRKRSAEDKNPLSSLGEAGGWQSHLSGFTSNFPVKGSDQFGLGNFPGINQASGSGASAAKRKRSAADKNPLSSLGEAGGWQSHLSGFTSNFPVKGADQFGIGNFPGMSQASGSVASAEKRKRSAADGNTLSSLGDTASWQSHLNGFTSNFPVKGADQFGIGNFPGMSQASGSDASAEKRKRSAADGNTLSSLGDTASWQSHLNGFTSNFPVKGSDQFGLGNFPGISQASGSGASTEKRKRSAADKNPLSSLGEAGGWQSHLNGFTSNFPVKGADQLGIGNFPGMSQASGSDASAEKRKRSAADKNPLSSLGEAGGWQSHLNGFTSNFPVKGADQLGIGNFPGMSQASGSDGSAEKRKRSSHESSPSWTEKLKSLFTGSGAE